MKLFLDSADIDEIKIFNKTGLIDGVTTNPSLIAKTNKPMLDTIEKICEIVDGDVSAEVTALDKKNMVLEGIKLAEISPRVVVKVPLTADGLLACRELSKINIKVNVTLCFSSAQAILSAKAGASYISPFIGRLNDIGSDGLNLISEIVEIYNNFSFKTQILAASIRGVQDIIDVSMLGVDVATIPPNIFQSMYKHPLTDIGLKNFLSDWEKTGQKIL